MSPAIDQSLSLLTDIAYGIIFAAAASHVARLFRQPLILGYVLGGVLLGTHLGFGLVTNEANIELISEIGLNLLLFIIGMEINLRELVKMGKSMLTLGIVQFAACVAFGLLAFRFFGYRIGNGNFDLLYIAVAAALSSTLIVVKLLHDKFEIHTVAGRLPLRHRRGRQADRNSGFFCHALLCIAGTQGASGHVAVVENFSGSCGVCAR